MGRYLSNIKLFNQSAKHWIEEFSNPERNLQKKIKELLDMGFTEEQARDAYKKIMKMLKRLLIIWLE